MDIRIYPNRDEVTQTDFNIPAAAVFFQQPEFDLDVSGEKLFAFGAQLIAKFIQVAIRIISFDSESSQYLKEGIGVMVQLNVVKREHDYLVGVKIDVGIPPEEVPKRIVVGFEEKSSVGHSYSGFQAEGFIEVIFQEDSSGVGHCRFELQS